MRALWTGEIAFGLVAVPVKLYSATKNLSPRFHLIHKTDGSRIEYKRFCKKEGVEVPWDEIGKGYEVSKGRYALFSKEELAEIEGEEAAEGIDIVEFIDPTEIDPAYVEKSYWVGPAGKTTRSYELLRTALEKTGKVAIARVKLRSRTRLAMLRPRAGRFALDTIRFPDELVPANEVDVPKSKQKPAGKELDLAMDLVERMTTTFDPDKHPDDYRAAVLSAVEQKEAHDEVAEEVEQDEERGKVVDLAEMLSRSLGAADRPVRKHAPAAAARTAKRPRRGTTTRTKRKASPSRARRSHRSKTKH